MRSRARLVTRGRTGHAAEGRRTRPPGGKRDVALNSTILIVFSEPIDARALNDASIRLLRDGVPVDGRLGFQDASHLVVAFTPVALDGATEYQLVVTQSLRDLDGEQLETPVTVEFTTVEATESARVSRIAFSDWRSISVISATAPTSRDLSTTAARDGNTCRLHGRPTAARSRSEAVAMGAGTFTP